MNTSETKNTFFGSFLSFQGENNKTFKFSDLKEIKLEGILVAQLNQDVQLIIEKNDGFPAKVQFIYNNKFHQCRGDLTATIQHFVQGARKIQRRRIYPNAISAYNKLWAKVDIEAYGNNVANFPASKKARIKQMYSELFDGLHQQYDEFKRKKATPEVERLKTWFNGQVSTQPLELAVSFS